MQSGYGEDGKDDKEGIVRTVVGYKYKEDGEENKLIRIYGSAILFFLFFIAAGGQFCRVARLLNGIVLHTV